MKDGRVFCAPIQRFRPEEGYLILIGSDERLFIENMESAITEDPRFGDGDELKRARKMT